MPKFIFKSSGLAVTYNRVPRRLLEEFSLQHKRRLYPKPPVQTLNVSGEQVQEENVADPEYQQAIQGYNLQFGIDLNRFIVKRAVKSFDKEAVKQLRTETAGDIELPPEDVLVFVYFIAAIDDAETWELADAVLSKSQVSEEGTTAQVAMFQGDV